MMKGPKILRIGQAEENDVRFLDSDIGPAHAEIFIDNENNVFLTDLGSRSHTFVNGKSISDPVILHAGDKVRFGSAATYDWEYHILGRRAERKEEAQKASKPTPTPSSNPQSTSKSDQAPSIKKDTINRDLWIILGAIVFLLLLLNVITG
jgi:pSer/pThr/pTyr-binding forkhead associated (FHA) protein